MTSRKITLTFDNGPHPEVTPHVLDVLRRHGLQAYFFIVGQQLEKYGPDLTRQAQAEGHRIGNHTYHHGVPLGLQPGGDAVAEIDRTDELLVRAGIESRLFRPFGGQGRIGPHLMNKTVWARLQERRYDCILWNCLAGEGRNPHGWVAPTLARTRELDHSVVVVHDIPTGAMAHIEEFVCALKDEAAEFTLDMPHDCLPMKGGVQNCDDAFQSHIVGEG